MTYLFEIHFTFDSNGSMGKGVGYSTAETAEAAEIAYAIEYPNFRYKIIKTVVSPSHFRRLDAGVAFSG